MGRGHVVGCGSPLRSRPPPDLGCPPDGRRGGNPSVGPQHEQRASLVHRRHREESRWARDLLLRRTGSRQVPPASGQRERSHRADAVEARLRSREAGRGGQRAHLLSGGGRERIHGGGPGHPFEGTSGLHLSPGPFPSVPGTARKLRDRTGGPQSGQGGEDRRSPGEAHRDRRGLGVRHRASDGGRRLGPGVRRVHLLRHGTALLLDRGGPFRHRARLRGAGRGHRPPGAAGPGHRSGGARSGHR